MGDKGSAPYFSLDGEPKKYLSEEDRKGIIWSVIFIGPMGSGKSSIINSIVCDNNALPRVTEARNSISAVTKDVIYIKARRNKSNDGGSLCFIDTPGIGSSKLAEYQIKNAVKTFKFINKVVFVVSNRLGAEETESIKKFMEAFNYKENKDSFVFLYFSFHPLADSNIKGSTDEILKLVGADCIHFCNDNFKEQKHYKINKSFALGYTNSQPTSSLRDLLFKRSKKLDTSEFHLNISTYTPSTVNPKEKKLQNEEKDNHNKGQTAKEEVAKTGSSSAQKVNGTLSQFSKTDTSIVNDPHMRGNYIGGGAAPPPSAEQPAKEEAEEAIKLCNKVTDETDSDKESKEAEPAVEQTENRKTINDATENCIEVWLHKNEDQEAKVVLEDSKLEDLIKRLGLTIFEVTGVQFCPGGKGVIYISYKSNKFTLRKIEKSYTYTKGVRTTLVKEISQNKREVAVYVSGLHPGTTNAEAAAKLESVGKINEAVEPFYDVFQEFNSQSFLAGKKNGSRVYLMDVKESFDTREVEGDEGKIVVSCFHLQNN